jgi:hypothetical protein
LNLALGAQAFGVVAPKAAQGAALEEDCGPDAWPIVDGEALKVEDEAARQSQRS